MAVRGKIYVCSLFTLLPLLSLTVKIERDVVDNMDTNSPTWKCRGSRPSNCVCSSTESTIMSQDGNWMKCTTPEKLGCDYADMRTRQAFFVNDNEYQVRVSQGIREQSCREIQRIFIWSMIGFKSTWIDVTAELKTSFTLRNIKKQPWDAHLFVSKQKRYFFAGHLLKIEFGTGSFFCGNCLIVKFKGTNNYPFDLKQFNSNFDMPQIKTTAKAVIKTTTKAVIKTTAKTIGTTKKQIKTKRKITQLPFTVKITTYDKVKTNSNVTEILSKKDVIPKDLSVTMAALISGIFALLTLAIFLLVIFCRRRFRNNPKLKGDDYSNENGGQLIGTSTKSKSFEWDAVKLIPSKSPTASQHSSRHDNCELQPTKYDEITKEYDFDNYECIFGTKNGNENHTPLVPPDYAEIRPDYENCDTLENQRPIERRKQRSNKSSLKEKQDNPHEYSAIAGADAVYETFDINQTLKHKQFQNENVQLHQYAEIEEHQNGDYTELNREDSIDKYNSLEPETSINQSSVEYEVPQEGPITSNTPPPQYETINIEHGDDSHSDSNKFERKNRKQCSTKSRDRFFDDANVKQYNDVIQMGENSVIKSVVHNGGVASNSTDLDLNNEDGAEFSNPAYEEHLVIIPDQSDDNVHSYENNPVDISSGGRDSLG